MTAPGALPPLPPVRRVAAWLACGPLGHLYAGLADWAVLFSAYAWSRARARMRS